MRPVQLIHIEAFKKGIDSVRVIENTPQRFLKVELPDGSQASVYYSSTLASTMKKFFREHGEEASFQNIKLFPKKHEHGFITWDVVRDVARNDPTIPRFLLKDED